MTAIDIFRAPAAAPASGIGARLRAALSSWVETRTTREALNRLTDRELDDIGLCRADIERVARGR